MIGWHAGHLIWQEGTPASAKGSMLRQACPAEMTGYALEADY